MLEILHRSRPPAAQDSIVLLSGRFDAAGQIEKVPGDHKLHDDKLVSRVAPGSTDVRVEEILTGTGRTAGNLQVRAVTIERQEVAYKTADDKMRKTRLHVMTENRLPSLWRTRTPA